MAATGRKWRAGGRKSPHDGGEEDVGPGARGGPSEGPGRGHAAAAAAPAARGAGERQLRRRPPGGATPAREAATALQRHRRDREEEEEDARGSLQGSLPEKLPGAAGGAEPERGRGPQLRLGRRGPVPAAAAPLLRRVRLPLGLHLRHLRGQVLLHPLPGHPPGHQVPEVDGVTPPPIMAAVTTPSCDPIPQWWPWPRPTMATMAPPHNGHHGPVPR